MIPQIRHIALIFLMLAVTVVAASAQSVGWVSPADTSVSPENLATLTFSATYPTSTTLPELDVVLTNNGGGVNACAFVFYQNHYPDAPAIYLFNDNESAWAGSVVLGVPQAASNSHCTIYGAQSSATYNQGSGTLSITVVFSFANVWAGQILSFYGQAVSDNTSSSSGWFPYYAQDSQGHAEGASLRVVAPSLGPPQLGTVTPANGSSSPNMQNNFLFTASDPNGFSTIDQMNIIISPNHNGMNSCFMVFFPHPPNVSDVYLFDNNVLYWTPVALGYSTVGYSSGSASNSQCEVMGSGSGYSGSGNTLNVTLDLTFSASFVGVNYFDEYLLDTLAGTVGWATLPGLSFGVTGTPTAVSVTPGFGMGPSQTFDFRFQELPTASYVTFVEMQFTGLGGTCWAHYSFVPGLTGLSLRQDNGTWSTQNLTNSLCTVSMAPPGPQFAGTSLDVFLAVTFTGQMSGPLSVYSVATANSGSSGFQQQGNWTASGSTTQACQIPIVVDDGLN